MRVAALVANPVLRLEAAHKIAALPDDAKDALRSVLLELSRQAADQAQESWRRHKGPMACYWKAVSVYARHMARVAR